MHSERKFKGMRLSFEIKFSDLKMEKQHEILLTVFKSMLPPESSIEVHNKTAEVAESLCEQIWSEIVVEVPVYEDNQTREDSQY